jgi:hypothetical protein
VESIQVKASKQSKAKEREVPTDISALGGRFSSITISHGVLQSPRLLALIIL